ncbi:MAG: Gfo/Idh/MocA family oxidoreductase [Alphaproteobacteria bacterium]
MSAPARVGVIGTGYWGRNLVRNFDALGALAAFCDVDPNTVANFSRQYPHAAPFTDPADLLASDTVTSVAIATPAASHGELVAAALAAGKHVFVEKPLCLDIAEGRALADLAHDRGLTLMVGHLLLYHPAFIALCRAVESGRLGTLRYIYSNRLSLGKIRREENAFWSFAPHDISMILRLAGAMPERVVTNGGTFLSPSVADTTLSHLTFPGGLQAHIFVSWLHPYKDHRLVVVGADGMAVFDDVLAGADKLSLYAHSVDWNGGLPSINKAEAEAIAYDETEPLSLECGHFLDCVATGGVPVSDAAEGLRVLTVLDAGQRSLAQGAPIIIASEAS